MPELKTELLKKISEEISPEAVQIWFDDCGFTGLRNGRIEMEIPSEFKRKMLEKRLGDIVRKAVEELAGKAYPVCFVPGSSNGENGPSFEDFVRGKGNELALACVLAATDRPAEKLPHPVYIYGEKDTGKTHLLLSAKKRIETLSPELRALYASADEFVELFGVPQKDFLLLDDFFTDDSGKLASYVKTALGKGTNIIAAGRIPPDEAADAGSFLLPGTDILCTPADIQPPDVETRQAIDMVRELRKGSLAVSP